MTELLEAYTNISNIDILKTASTFDYIIAGIIVVIVAFFCFCMSHFVYEHHIIASILVSMIISLFTICMLLGIITSSNAEEYRVAKMTELVNIAIEQDLDLQITDKYMLYEGEVYEHKISNIDSYVIMDKDGNLILIQD